MGFAEHEQTPVSDLSPLAEMGFDPDGDPTPIQMPGRRAPDFVDPFDGDTVVASPALDFQVTGTGPGSQPRVRAISPPAYPIPDVLRPPATITRSSQDAGVPEERTGPTTPARLDPDQLFDTLEVVEETPLPPPMLMDPPARARGGLLPRASGSARRETRRGFGWGALVLCALGGAAAASAGFFVAGQLRSRSAAADHRPAPALAADDLADDGAHVPAGKLVERNLVTTAGDRAPGGLELEPPAVTAPAPAAAPPAADPGSSQRPAEQAGEQVARAIRPCLTGQADRSVRVAVYLLPAGTIRRAFIGRNAGLQARHNRCIKRRLEGLTLEGYHATGYLDWRLSLRGDGEAAVLLGRRALPLY